MKRTVTLILMPVIVALLPSCGPWPPNVSQVADMEKLDANSTYSIRARGLPDGSIPALAKFQKLKQIDFQGACAVRKLEATDLGLLSLSEIDLPDLETISIAYSNKITDRGILAISKIGTLRQIIIDGLPEITNKSLEYLAEMPHLDQLFLCGCPGITDDGIQLLRTYPSLRWVMVGGMNFGSSQETKECIGCINNIDMNMETQITVDGFVKAFKGSNLEIIDIDTLNPEFFTEQSKALFCSELSEYRLTVRTLVGPRLEEIKAWRASECEAN